MDANKRKREPSTEAAGSSFRHAWQSQSKSDMTSEQGMSDPISSSSAKMSQNSCSWNNVLITISDASNKEQMTWFKASELAPPMTVTKLIAYVRALPGYKNVSNVRFKSEHIDGTMLSMERPDQFETLVGWKRAVNPCPVTSLNLVMHCKDSRKTVPESVLSPSNPLIDLTGEGAVGIKEEHMTPSARHRAGVLSSSSHGISAAETSISPAFTPAPASPPTSASTQTFTRSSASSSTQASFQPESEEDSHASANSDAGTQDDLDSQSEHQAIRTTSVPQKSAWSEAEDSLLYQLYNVDGLKGQVLYKEFRKQNSGRTVIAVESRVRRQRHFGWTLGTKVHATTYGHHWTVNEKALLYKLKKCEDLTPVETARSFYKQTGRRSVACAMKVTESLEADKWAGLLSQVENVKADKLNAHIEKLAAKVVKEQS